MIYCLSFNFHLKIFRAYSRREYGPKYSICGGYNAPVFYQNLQSNKMECEIAEQFRYSIDKK